MRRITSRLTPRAVLHSLFRRHFSSGPPPPPISRSHTNTNSDANTDTLNDMEGPVADLCACVVRVSDRYGMPAELPAGAPRTFADLSALCPGRALRDQLARLVASRGWRQLTAVQRAAMAVALERRDVLCIAPTATGKTFSYVFPGVLRALAAGAAEEHGGAESERSSVEALLREQIARGEVCRYCELRMESSPVCPMTGAPHRKAHASDSGEANSESPQAVADLPVGAAEPKLLVLVPTAQLAVQVRALCAQLDAGELRVRFLARASSAEEQRQHLRALSGCDVLVAAPETLLPALLKHRLSLRRVAAVVLDEVDDLVSANHFDALRVVLGALPKGARRPQRLLFGASLPPAAHDMLRAQMLLPSHRFVLAERTARSAAGAKQVTHCVLMLSQVEKMGRLAALYAAGKLRVDQRVLIFCNSRHNVAYVAERLEGLVQGLRVASLTARASATARAGAMKLFESGAATCLVCTDLLSRGIDFAGVVCVVHYDMPQDFDTWIHRCGRCGRNGMRGYCFSFFQPENVRLAKPLVAHLRQAQEIVPPKLQEYSTQAFVDTFKTSLFHDPTRPHREGDPQRKHPVLGRGTARFPDYHQERLNRHSRPR